MSLSEKKRPRASLKAPRKTYFICETPSGKEINQVVFYDADGMPFYLNGSIREAIVFKTKKEKEAHRRLYRKEYSTRPATREKIAKRLADPEVQRKRKEYAEREDVKRRKKENAAQARAVRRKLKEEMPETYEQLSDRVRLEMEETDKWLNGQINGNSISSDSDDVTTP